MQIWYVNPLSYHDQAIDLHNVVFNVMKTNWLQFLAFDINRAISAKFMHIICKYHESCLNSSSTSDAVQIQHWGEPVWEYQKRQCLDTENEKAVWSSFKLVSKFYFEVYASYA